MFKHLSELWCAFWKGHEFIIRYERNRDLGIKRVYAICVHCKKETRGFDI